MTALVVLAVDADRPFDSDDADATLVPFSSLP